MKGVYKDVVIDPPPNEILYLEEGSSNVELRNLALDGWTFFVRSSTDILIEGGTVGNTDKGQNCKIGGAYKTTKLCERITVRGVTFHDMVIDDPAKHHEALFICDSDGILVENCVFGPNVWGNTADLFFTVEQTKQISTNVIVRGNHFMPPSNPTGKSAIQFGDKRPGTPAADLVAPYANYLIEGNLFEGCSPTFGTILRPVTNFKVGINYGDLSKNMYDYAVKMGIEFEEWPFRPASEWPGPIGVTPPLPETPEDPCADLRLELAVVTKKLEDSQDTIAVMQAKMDHAVETLQG